MITAASPWRNLGNVTLLFWRNLLVSTRSPIAAEWQATYDAAYPHTVLALAMMDVESRYATRFNENVPENKNPLNLRPPSGDGYLAFNTYADAVRAWRDRITSPTYKGGIYDKTVTILELIERYAPANDSNDPSAYAAIVAARASAWRTDSAATVTNDGGNAPMSDNLQFGRVPYPAVVASHLPASNPMVVESGAPDVPEAVVWHRMLGSWNGTNTFFHQGNAATAYGVAVASRDGESLAGSIYEWIAPRTGWYGESSGPCVAPYGDGAALVARVGVASVNRVSKAIEISGDYDTPLDPKSRAAIVAMTAYWADQARIPWTDFPMVPGQDRSFVCWHQEFTGPAYKICPGPVVMAETPALIAAVKETLRAAQTVAPPVKPPQYTPPMLPEWWADALAQSWPSDAKDGELMYRVAQRKAEAIKPAVRHCQPSTKAERSGPNVQVREKVFVERVLRADGADWLVTNDGHYVAAASFTPRIQVTPR